MGNVENFNAQAAPFTPATLGISFAEVSSAPVSPTVGTTYNNELSL